MINFIEVKDKYSNNIYYINANHIVCIKESGDDSVIILNHHNNINITVNLSPSYLCSLIDSNPNNTYW